LKTIDR